MATLVVTTQGAFLRCAGGQVVVKTDASWVSGFTPVTGNGIYHGEDYDARITPTDTHGVEVLPFDRALLIPHETGAVKEMDPVAPLDSWADGETTVYDFGQNCGAYVRIAVEGPAGAHVRVEFSEVLGPNREFDNRNFRSARAEQHYTLKGEGVETVVAFIIAADGADVVAVAVFAVVEGAAHRHDLAVGQQGDRYRAYLRTRRGAPHRARHR